MDTKEVQISVIIPAYNEECVIGSTLDTLHDALEQFIYEIIVIDNASADSTADVAIKKGATVFYKPDGTIAALRNFGVKQSSGNILVFIDADIVITKDWKNALPGTYKKISKNHYFITGARYSSPDDANWIEKVWFPETIYRTVAHLGAGNLIMSRKLFDLTSGFDETLITGEDHDLCRRARCAGAEIINDPALRVIHYGSPNTFSAFIKREIWYGKGDVNSIGDMIKSKVVIATILFFFLHIVIAAGIFVNYMVSVSGLLLLLALLCYSAFTRHREICMNTFIPTAILFYFYYIGRGVAIFYHQDSTP